MHYIPFSSAWELGYFQLACHQQFYNILIVLIFLIDRIILEVLIALIAPVIRFPMRVSSSSVALTVLATAHFLSCIYEVYDTYQRGFKRPVVEKISCYLYFENTGMRTVLNS